MTADETTTEVILWWNGDGKWGARAKHGRQRGWAYVADLADLRAAAVEAASKAGGSITPGTILDIQCPPTVERLMPEIAEAEAHAVELCQQLRAQEQHIGYTRGSKSSSPCVARNSVSTPRCTSSPTDSRPKSATGLPKSGHRLLWGRERPQRKHFVSLLALVSVAQPESVSLLLNPPRRLYQSAINLPDHPIMVILDAAREVEHLLRVRVTADRAGVC